MLVQLEGKLTLISILSFVVLTRNKDFRTALALGITMLRNIVFAIITFLHCEKVLKNLHNFFNFVNISSIAFIAFYCKIRLALTCGILADPVTYTYYTSNMHCTTNIILYLPATTTLPTSLLTGGSNAA